MNFAYIEKGGELNGPCADYRHRGNKNAKANYYNTSQKCWVCFECAQKENRESLQLRVKLGINTNRPCITEKERLIQLLKE